MRELETRFRAMMARLRHAKTTMGIFAEMEGLDPCEKAQFLFSVGCGSRQRMSTIRSALGRIGLSPELTVSRHVVRLAPYAYLMGPEIEAVLGGESPAWVQGIIKRSGNSLDMGLLGELRGSLGGVTGWTCSSLMGFLLSYDQTDPYQVEALRSALESSGLVGLDFDEMGTAFLFEVVRDPYFLAMESVRKDLLCGAR